MGWCKGEGNSRSKDHHKSFWRKCKELRPDYYDERGVYVQPSCHDIDIIRRALKEDIDVSGIAFRFKNNELRTMFMEILDDIVELKKRKK